MQTIAKVSEKIFFFNRAEEKHFLKNTDPLPPIPTLLHTYIPSHEYRSVDPVAVPVAQHVTMVGLGLEDHDREARPAEGRFLARCDRIELLGYIVEFLFPMFILTPT